MKYMECLVRGSHYIPQTQYCCRNFGWLAKGKAVESDSEGDDDEDDENEKSVVLDDGVCLLRNQVDEGSPGSVSPGQSDVESSGGGSSESNLEEENGTSYKRDFKLGEEGLGSGNSAADPVCPVEPKSGVCDHEILELREACGSEAVNASVEGSASEAVDIGMEVSASEAVKEGMEVSASEAVNAGMGDSGSEAINVDTDGSESRAVNTETKVAIGPSLDIHEGTAVQSTSSSGLEGPLNFDDFSSATEMEVLGMERLETELQVCGLKCGGTLQERAARLYLLKMTPIEMLPKKLLAKPDTKVNGYN